ncbi:FecR family protein [Novosphingobium sp. PhB55]|uniref:FecR family protein n=1 Tax=Novosphingobium sp. PhB55 TaxID=2485106 RepID=UPI0010667651|nr:FecR domain-containing protein [Novosphingobium sp. PhB55]TDW63434.1 FecR family protein [Novosphingobium sp. PhB55]
MSEDDKIRAEALDWAVRAGDPAFEDWEGFTRWLDENPAHAAAYDRIAASVLDGAELIAAATPANDDGGETPVPTGAAPRRSARPWIGGALAASLALVAGLWMWQAGSRDLYRIETAPGQVRTVVLDAQTRVDLAGGTAMAFDRKDPRFARLESGQALFTVRHDEARPFRVTVGKDTLVDVGTVFDVRSQSGDLSVAVSEGAVQFNPEAQDLRIAPGEILQRRGRSGDYTLGKIAPEQVGEWRGGRVTFQDTALSAVAADLARATGVDYRVAPGSAERQVSGSLLVAPLRKNPAALGPLLGVEVRAERPDGADPRWVIGVR